MKVSMTAWSTLKYYYKNTKMNVLKKPAQGKIHHPAIRPITYPVLGGKGKKYQQSALQPTEQD